MSPCVSSLPFPASFFPSVCYTTETVFDDVLRIGKNRCKNRRARAHERKRKKDCADLERKGQTRASTKKEY